MTDIRIIQRYEESLKNFNKANSLFERGETEEFKKYIKKSFDLFPREVLLDDSYNIEEEVKNSFKGLFNSIKEKIKEIEDSKNIKANKTISENKQNGINASTKQTVEKLPEIEKVPIIKDTQDTEGTKPIIENQDYSGVNGIPEEQIIETDVQRINQIKKAENLPENQIENKKEMETTNEKDNLPGESTYSATKEEHEQKEISKGKRITLPRFKFPKVSFSRVNNFFKINLKTIRILFVLLFTNAIIGLCLYWIVIKFFEEILPVYNIDKHFNLAIETLRKDELNKALEHFEKAISYSKGNKELIDNIENILLVKSIYLERKKKFGESRMIYENLLRYKKSDRLLKQYLNNYLKEAEELLKRNKLEAVDFILSKTDVYLNDKEFDRRLIPSYLVKIDTLKYKLYKRLLSNDYNNFSKLKPKEKFKNLKYITIEDKKGMEKLLSKIH